MGKCGFYLFFITYSTFLRAYIMRVYIYLFNKKCSVKSVDTLETFFGSGRKAYCSGIPLEALQKSIFNYYFAKLHTLSCNTLDNRWLFGVCSALNSVCNTFGSVYKLIIATQQQANSYVLIADVFVPARGTTAKQGFSSSLNHELNEFCLI